MKSLIELTLLKYTDHVSKAGHDIIKQLDKRVAMRKNGAKENHPDMVKAQKRIDRRDKGIKMGANAIERYAKKNFFQEDAPTNNVGGGDIAGCGVGPKGEPGVPKRKQAKNKSHVLFPSMMKRTEPNNIKEDLDTFAGAVVFEVNSNLFHNLTLAKKRGKHWRTYLEEDDCYAEIREWANKNKGPIIVRNENTGEMRYVRYRR